MPWSDATVATPQPLAGHLAENVMHFARVLRAAGLPIGSDRIAIALEALPIAGLASRDDLHATLAACLVDRPGHQLLFDQAFHLFWRDPDLRGRMMAMLLPRVQGRDSGPKPPQNRRLGDALFPKPGAQPIGPPRDEIEVDARLTFSDRERLFKADFETMTTDEWAEARRVIATLAHDVERIATRRLGRAARGRPDWRRTLQTQAKSGTTTLCRRAPRTRPVPLVVIADISGSMSRYTRMLLHFAHALATAGGEAGQVAVFVFGTRLTNITRTLRARDPDLAIASAVRAVDDWSGGTRLAACLADFNRHWSRRVQAQTATVLLISDGLGAAHDDMARLSFETARLARSCRHLVWLNPLLRYAGFEPKAAGIRAMLPHVDRFVPAHNLDSIAALAAALSSHHEQPRGVDRWN